MRYTRICFSSLRWLIFDLFAYRWANWETGNIFLMVGIFLTKNFKERNKNISGKNWIILSKHTHDPHRKPFFLMCSFIAGRVGERTSCCCFYIFIPTRHSSCSNLCQNHIIIETPFAFVIFAFHHHHHCIRFMSESSRVL